MLARPQRPPSRPPPACPGRERSCVSRRPEAVVPGAGRLVHAEPAAGAMRMTRADDPARPQRPARQPDPVRERDRTAAEIQDQVIKAIFAVGLRLQDTAAITIDPLVRRQVENALSDLDDVIRLIRNAVFGLTGLSGARQHEQNLAIWRGAITAHPELGPAVARHRLVVVKLSAVALAGLSCLAGRWGWNADRVTGRLARF